MQRRIAVLVFLREQKYIQILNWNKTENTITYKEAKERYVDGTVTPKTVKIKVKHNLVFIGNNSFKRSYLKAITNANKIS